MVMNNSLIKDFLRLALILMASVQVAIAILAYKSGGFFIDLMGYVGAVHRYLEHQNPYEFVDTPFVYHPLVLQVMSFAGDQLERVMVFLYVLSGIFFLVSIKNREDGFFAFYLAFAYLALGPIHLAGGNLTLPLHLFLLGLLLRGLDSPPKAMTFIIFTILCSVIKPYFLAYIAIPFVLNLRRGVLFWRTLEWTLISIICMAVVLMLHFHFYPNLLDSFLSNVQQQTMTRNDLGQGFFMLFYKSTKILSLSLLLHLGLLMAIGALPLVKLYKSNDIDSQSLGLYLYFLMTLLNPRVKEYDIVAGLFTLFLSWLSISRGLFKELVLFVAFSLSSIRVFLLFIHSSTATISISSVVYFGTILIVSAAMLIEVLYWRPRYEAAYCKG